MTRVGFVGLGSQGAPMAARIIDAGYPTTLWARRPETLAPFADTTAATAATLPELGAACDVLCICVVADDDVDAVLRGPHGALAGMTAGSIIVVHSTVHPATCHRLRDDFPAFQFVDAPVSGGGHKAAAGELLVMVGGADDAVARCRPIFATFGEPVLQVGALGAGQEVKLLNNLIFTAQLALAAEVFDIAAARELDPVAVAAVLVSGSGRSYAADLVAGSGYTLDGLAPIAGPLLAKDAGILAAHARLQASVLLAAADAGLARMHVTRSSTKQPSE